MKKIILLLLWLLCVGAAMSQAPKKVGVYVTGEVNAGNKKIAGQKIMSGISSNPDFSATERTVSFLAELSKDHDYKVNAPVNEARIMEIGRQFGLDYVVVAELTEAMGELVISSKMMDVQGNSQAVSAENIVKVRQARDLMRAAEDVAKQLLDNLNKQEQFVADLHMAQQLLDRLQELEATAIQPEVQESAIVAETQVRPDSVGTLSSESWPRRIAIKKVIDNDGLLSNGVKMMLKSFITDYFSQLHGYQLYNYEMYDELYDDDALRPTASGIGGSRVDGLLIIEVNGLGDGNIVYTAKLLDYATMPMRVVGTATLAGNNKMDAYRRDVEKLLDKLLVKNR